MLFITAGMGGGTGTGAAPIIAQLAHEEGILTIAIVTKPFEFEGRKRMLNALEGINKIKEYVDTLLVIPNEKLVEIYSDMSQREAYDRADEVLRNAVKGITEIITKPTVINLDFADIQTTMRGAGLAHMGIGEAVGTDEDIVIQAVQNAVNSPLIETNITGAKAVIINYLTPSSIKIKQINEATKLIGNVVDPEANIIFGQGFDDEMGDKVQVTLIATGFSDNKINNGSVLPKQPISISTEQVKENVEEPIKKAEPEINSNVQSNASSEISKFEKEIATHPAFQNMVKVGAEHYPAIKKKVDQYRDPMMPSFLKKSIEADLKSINIDVTKL